jgi:predicted enzyme related to lactoylglutathione lyase
MSDRTDRVLEHPIASFERIAGGKRFSVANQSFIKIRELSMSKVDSVIFYIVVSLPLIFMGGKAQNNSATDKTVNVINEKKKVTGIGGIFFKAKDPGKIKEWYDKNLGLVTNEYGSMFEFRQSDYPEKKAYLQWSPFNENTKYFKPSEKEFMINYRVENIETLTQELKKNGVTFVDTIETYEYGKFVHILDPENNKIELWEPVDNEFTKSYDGKTTK